MSENTAKLLTAAQVGNHLNVKAVAVLRWLSRDSRLTKFVERDGKQILFQPSIIEHLEAEIRARRRARGTRT